MVERRDALKEILDVIHSPEGPVSPASDLVKPSSERVMRKLGVTQVVSGGEVFQVKPHHGNGNGRR